MIVEGVERFGLVVAQVVFSPEIRCATRQGRFLPRLPADSSVFASATMDGSRRSYGGVGDGRRQFESLEIDGGIPRSQSQQMLSSFKARPAMLRDSLPQFPT